MELKVDDLLGFCAYYTLAKTATKIPHSSNPPQKNNIEPSPIKSSNRKKVQVLESKRVNRPKVEHVSTINSTKKSVSHIQKQQPKKIKEEESKNKNFDLNYFVSHLASQSNQSNVWQGQSKLKQMNQGLSYVKKNQSNLQNYQTFGKSAGKQTQFQTFQQKMRKQGRSNLTDRQQRAYIYDQPEYMVSQFSVRPQQKQSHITQNNSWIGAATQKVVKSQFIDVEGKRSQHFTPFTFDNIGYQQSQSKIAYSPAKRQFTPTGSNISGRYSPDSHLSKSRTKHQRKKSERPFYDASKLTVKKQAESMVRDNGLEQNTLSQSFVTIEDTNSVSLPRKINQKVEQSKRQTSTTAPPLRGNRQLKKIYRVDRNETDLDDALGQTLTELSHRKVPIALQLKMKGDSEY